MTSTTCHHRRRQHQRIAAAQIEVLESRTLLSGTGVTPIDGVGNNIENPDWGSAGVELGRITSVEYADGLSAPAGQGRPSAREVSNAVAAQDGSIPNDRYLTDFIWLWGQFLDHDLDLTENADPPQPLPIEVPAGDPFFDPSGSGSATIGFNRSISVDDADGVRQQINQITAFIDGSMIYGSDDVRAAALRTFEGGRLRTSDGDLLPFNVDGLPNAGGPSAALFLAGDVRSNENAALTAMHTLWVREHNRIADDIAEDHPGLSDAQVYRRARRLVIAEIQVITYNEFLPALLGGNAPGDYDGYDATVNPGISNIFSTAAFRLGHSLLSPVLLRVNNDGTVIDDGNLPLREAFFAPGEIIDHGIESLLLGAATQFAQELDVHVIDDVRNFLFGPPGAGGFDLASLNIQRGRDHGLADYNQARIDLGLAPVTSFAGISSDPDVQAALASVYDNVDEIDAWVGGLAEDHLPGSSLGELFTAVLVDQFERVRAGDRFWYENVFDRDELRRIEHTTLSDVIERNTTVTGLQENVFFDSSVLYYKADSRGDTSIAIRTDRGEIELVDRERRRTTSRPIAEVSQVILVGGHDTGLKVTIGVNTDAGQLPGGIVVYAGDGRRDAIRVDGTRGDDQVDVDGHEVRLNDLVIFHSGIERLEVKAGRGNDHVEILNSLFRQVRVYGEAGDDTLIGAPRAELLDGGPGNDTINGGGGDDTLIGGTGRDVITGRGRHDGLHRDGDSGDHHGGHAADHDRERRFRDDLRSERDRVFADSFTEWH